MKHMKRLTIVALLLAVTLFVAGCTERTIVIKWEPNPIVVKPGDQNIKGKATITVSSGISAVTIKKVSAIGYDENGEPVDGMTYSKDLNLTVPIIIGGSASQEVVFPIDYETARDSKVRKVVVSVEGSISGTLEIIVDVVEPDEDDDNDA